MNIIRKRCSTISWNIKKKAKEVLSKETGTIYKEHGGKVRVCLVYPNSYYLGMSNLGVHTLYRILNSLPNCVCERVFLPSVEDAEEYDNSKTPLISLETQTPVKDFDVVAFSISFEDDYFNLPLIFDLAEIPLNKKDRDESHPLTIAGGAAISMNPEPLSDFMDSFFIGEAEGYIKDIIDIIDNSMSEGLSREETLRGMREVTGVYVPIWYDFEYSDNKITKINISDGAPTKVRRAMIDYEKPFEVAQTVIMTPDTEFSNTYLVEIERGCGENCRFCPAGFLYLPPREHSLESVQESVQAGFDKTKKIGLVGAAVSEYTHIKDVLRAGIKADKEMTLSSLRLDVIDQEFLDTLKEAGYKTVTMAPEAATLRLRQVVNKDITDESILNSIEMIKKAGFNRVKLYFMIGLPTETDEDIVAMAELAKLIKQTLGKGKLILSINPFVPKPFTPFQWHNFEKVDILKRRFKILDNLLKNEKAIEVKKLTPNVAYTQAYLSLGDRRVGKVIEESYSKGVRRALKDNKVQVESIVHSLRVPEDVLPWDVIEHGLSRDYMWFDYKRSFVSQTTGACQVGSCFKCGVC